MTPQRILYALAIGLALALPGVSQAVIVYFPFEEIDIPNTYAGVSVDLELGGVSNSLAGVSGGDANFFLGGSRISNDGDASATSATWQPVRVGTGNTDEVQNLAFGTTIDASTDFYSTGFGGSGQTNSHFGGGTGFTDGESGYIGFSLIIDDPSDPGEDLLVYGWAEVTFENNDGTGTIHSWAYDDSGAAIEVGAVPEPAAAALALFAVGFTLLRRRR